VSIKRGKLRYCFLTSTTQKKTALYSEKKTTWFAGEGR
jgi:hypothetical protein